MYTLLPMLFETTLSDAPTLPYPKWSRHPLALQRTVLTIALVIADAVALTIAFRLAYWVRFELHLTTAPEIAGDGGSYLALAAVLIPLWLIVFALFNLYDRHCKLGGIVESSRTFNACTVATMLVVACTFVQPQFVIARVWLVAVWLLSFILVAAARFVSRRVVYAARRRGYLISPAAIVGTNQEAISLATFLGEWQSSGVYPVGLIRTTNSAGPPPSGFEILGSSQDIRSIVLHHGIEDLIIALTAISREELLELNDEVDQLPVHLRLSSGLYELLTTRVTVQTLGTVPLMTVHKRRLHAGELVIKTSVEIAVTLAALIALVPLFILIALLVKLDSAGPVLHRRRVLGAAGQEFDALKFRTMHVNGEQLLAARDGATDLLNENHKLRDDPRITRTGRWLRRFSLDELPQLFNVLRGQMSLVGPRMITAAEAAKYGRQRANLLTVKPGITGLWQVSGRSDLTYDERVRLDMYYVRNYSVWLDLQILFIETLPAVLKGRGAY